MATVMFVGATVSRRRFHWTMPALAMSLMSCSTVPTGSVGTVEDSVSPESSLPATLPPTTTWLETTLPSTTLPDSSSARCDRIGSQVIKEFVTAFNDGGIDLNPFFASGKEFQWYSDDQRVNKFGVRQSNPLHDPWNRDTLIAYLNEARRTRGPMNIWSLNFTGFRHFDQATGYAMMLKWRGQWHLGKASVHCRLGQINVWSLGPAKT